MSRVSIYCPLGIRVRIETIAHSQRHKFLNLPGASYAPSIECCDDQGRLAVFLCPFPYSPGQSLSHV